MLCETKEKTTPLIALLPISSRLQQLYIMVAILAAAVGSACTYTNGPPAGQGNDRQVRNQISFDGNRESQ